YFYALWAVLQILFKVALGTGDPLGALTQMAWGIIEPYGVLWFIYMLAVFSLATKLLWQFKVPHWAVLAAGAVLQMLPVATGSYIIDQFAEYFVFFYAGYALAPRIFAIIEWTQQHLVLALLAIAGWIALNTALVFSPGFEVHPDEIEMGLAALPGLRLALAFAGSIGLCMVASLLSRLDFMNWLRWVGE